MLTVKCHTGHEYTVYHTEEWKKLPKRFRDENAYAIHRVPDKQRWKPGRGEIEVIAFGIMGIDADGTYYGYNTFSKEDCIKIYNYVRIPSKEFLTSVSA